MFYAPLSSDAAKNLDWLRHLVRRRPLCACINDDLGGDGDWSKSAQQLHQVLERILPDAAPWEKTDQAKADAADAVWAESNQPLEIVLKSLVLIPAIVYCAAMMLEVFVSVGGASQR
jgi:hypothetical protein